MTLGSMVLSMLLAQGEPPPDAGGPPPAAPVIVPVAPGWVTATSPANDGASTRSTASATTTFIEPREVAPSERVADAVPSARILDLVEIEGVRSNQLQGIGLVTGLNGTGDKGAAARQALANFVQRNRLNVRPEEVDIANVALVTVICKLPPFAKAGTAVDVTVQSINGAKSLFGGALLQTPLHGADGEVYVVAQGSVPVGGFAGGGRSASVVQNHPTVGFITGGGIVEREVPMSLLSQDGALHLHLRNPSYVTASRVAAEITRAWDLPARALDAATVRVPLPESRRSDAVALVADLQARRITPGDEAVVIVNERTGTVVAGAQVRISTIAITHGNLTVTISESPEVSQPQPLAAGETAAVDRTDVAIDAEKRYLQVVHGTTSVNELVDSLNTMGVSPRDLISIFQALARAGALHARLEIL